MERYKSYLAPLIVAALFGSILPPFSASAIAPGADVYFFVGNDVGGRYAFLSNGDGTFATPVSLPTKGGINRGGASEDFDNDGDADFVGCNGNTGICYLFENVAGTFVDLGDVTGTTPMNNQEYGMIGDDFDLDGNKDFILAGFTPYFKVFLGNGNNTFNNSLTYTIPTNVPLRAKDSADINRDGYPDILVTHLPLGNVSVFMNDGTGQFNTPVTLFDTRGSSNDPLALAVADFDNDGFYDILAGASADGIISLWKGDGLGGFTLVADIYDFNSQAGIDNYDFNGDGNQDFVATVLTTKQVLYFEGNGDGTFQAPDLITTLTTGGLGIATPSTPPIRSTVSGVVYKDLNGDGVNNDAAGGFANVNVTLTGTDFLGNTVNETTTTDSEGTYAFEGVLNDSGTAYVLTLSSPPTDTVATTTASRSASVPLANTHVQEDFGFLAYSSVAGVVFNDANGNGIQDGSEGGVSSVTLELSGTNYLGETIQLSTESSGNGSFLFDDLLLSSIDGYTLTVASPPAGYEATTNEFSVVVISAGNSSASVSFGYKQLPQDGDIVGTVFDDVSQDGVLNGTETGIADIALQLTGTAFNGVSVSLSTTSSANGSYAFNDVAASNENGYTLTILGHPYDSEATTATSVTVILQPEELITTDFGFTFQLLPSGDKDSDGVLNAADVCPLGTVIPESVPTEELLKNHYAMTDTDGYFETGKNHEDSEYTIQDTGGCTCAQIIEALPGKKKGHEKFGCPKGIMENWIENL